MKHEIDVTFVGQSISPIRILYKRYAESYAESWKNAPVEYAAAIRSVVESETAIRFAQHVLDHPEELAEAQKLAEEINRISKEHLAKQPPEA